MSQVYVSIQILAYCVRVWQSQVPSTLLTLSSTSVGCVTLKYDITYFSIIFSAFGLGLVKNVESGVGSIDFKLCENELTEHPKIERSKKAILIIIIFYCCQLVNKHTSKLFMSACISAWNGGTEPPLAVGFTDLFYTGSIHHKYPYDEF